MISHPVYMTCMKTCGFQITVNFFTCLFILFLRQRECMNRGEAEREGERIPSRLHTFSAEPDVGLKLRNSEIMT